ncbi:MAG: DUF2848 domain-containing protein [Pseudomonadota bacterium]
MRFTLVGHGAVDVAIHQLIIAGWSGRDPDAFAHHIAELAALGVSPPSETPLFYRVGADRLTQASSIQVVGSGTSGEAEALLVALPGGLAVGLASDHTDRDAEAHSVALSKQLCPKPAAQDLWPLSDVAGHWDALTLHAWATIAGERVLYQEGTLAGLLPPDALLKLCSLAPGGAMLCGTLPALGGIRPASRFEMELADPVLGRSITHSYEIAELPAVT